MRREKPAPELGPWNPGLTSRLPTEIRHLATIYRPENIKGSMDDALERSAFTGLDPEDHVGFKPERLVVHELLIRVTGDFSVPDGRRYADLGINFRGIVDTILKADILPVMADITGHFSRLREELRDEITTELEQLQAPPPASGPSETETGWFRRWLGFGTNNRDQGQPVERRADRERRHLAAWRLESTSSPDPRRRRVCRALVHIVGAISIRYGRVQGDPAMLADLVTDSALNDHGSAVVGDMIAPMIKQAAEREGYRLLPTQSEPVVMNVKGASAAGKSTLRPLQRKLAERLGIDWADFALISPDIWRKYLLDYDSLGDFWRYAGTLTGHELKMIDQKLDRYMAEKARRGAISHLLIDRFRFDSFAEIEGGEQGARLLTRFGATIYMFFVITPPDATVERAWKRGLEFGRFKAVDDLLHHNVEAFTGMPDLFFTWALRRDKRVHYEFLDNSVPLGERPRTVAFGWNEDMTILDVKCLLDVDRYKRVRINATTAEEVYPETELMAPANNTDFLKRCQKMIRAIQVADQNSGRLMARLEAGKLIWVDHEAVEQASADPDVAAGMAVLAPEPVRTEAETADRPAFLDPSQTHTLGRYGKPGNLPDQD